jgi:hypothetical protein
MLYESGGPRMQHQKTAEDYRRVAETGSDVLRFGTAEFNRAIQSTVRI